MLHLANLTVHHTHTQAAVFVLDSVYIVDTYHHEVASTTTCIKKARNVMATTACRVSMALTQPEEDGLFMNSILKEQLWKEQKDLVSWYIPRQHFVRICYTTVCFKPVPVTLLASVHSLNASSSIHASACAFKSGKGSAA